MIIRWFKRIFLGWKSCGLCKQDFQPWKPDVITFRHSNTDFEEMKICVGCASILEAAKMREPDVMFSVRKDNNNE